jgi:hypothetical protein
MGTKNQPGEFDCYAAANPDEPMFIMLGRDGSAAGRVRSWARRYWWRKVFPLLVRRNLLWETIDSRVILRRERKYHEALQCALSMDAWWLGTQRGQR